MATTLVKALDIGYLSRYNNQPMRIYIAFLLGLLFTINAQAQRAKIGCMDKNITVQAGQIKHDFRAQGMEVYKDAMLSMQSQEPYPVAIQLTQGQLYQFIFVGSKQSSRIYFELFNGRDEKIESITLKGKDGKNFIVYSFLPQKSDVYLIVAAQKIKGKTNVCGSFTVMQQLKSKKSN